MQHLEVSCAVRRFLKSLGFKGLRSELFSKISDSSQSLRETELPLNINHFII